MLICSYLTQEFVQLQNALSFGITEWKLNGSGVSAVALPTVVMRVCVVLFACNLAKCIHWCSCTVLICSEHVCMCVYVCVYVYMYVYV